MRISDWSSDVCSSDLPMRRMRGAYGLKRLGAVSTGHMIDGGDGVRLHGLHTTLPGMQPRGLALLLHGWEGSTESSYMRMTAVQLLRRGFEVFRLNFRDHGGTHHLHEDLFPSNRIDEVVHAACDIPRRLLPAAGPPRPMVAAGPPLGGNIARQSVGAGKGMS